MKRRIAYNILTYEVVEAYTTKKNFHAMLTRIKRSDREFYGAGGCWVFRDPWH